MHDLNDMVLFADVIDHGGFTAASRVSGIPKSRISRRIARLERELGLQLMHRSSRRLSMTPDGELFLVHCRAMREAARTAHEELARVRAEPRGLVRLSCPVTLVYGLLSRAMPTFLHRYPHVRVDVRSLNRPVDPIDEGVDIALRVRPTIEDSTRLVAKSLGSSRGGLFVGPELLGRQGPVDVPDDLARLDTVSMPGGDGSGRWPLVGPDGRVHVHTHRPRYVSDDLAMLLDAAVAGCGAAVLPEYLCREALDAGRLTRILPGWGPPPGILHAVYPARRTLVPAVRVLLEFLQETLVIDEPLGPDAPDPNLAGGRGVDQVMS